LFGLPRGSLLEAGYYPVTCRIGAFSG